jgi:Mg-chelatase subunit ChlD
MIQMIDFRHHRVALQLIDRRFVYEPLTSNPELLLRHLAPDTRPTYLGLPPNQLDMSAGNFPAVDRPERVPVAILVYTSTADGLHRGDPADLVPIWDMWRAQGIVTFGVALGVDMAPPSDQGREIVRAFAGADERTFESPEVIDLFGVYDHVRRYVQTSLAGDLELVDDMAADIDFVPRSARPRAREAGDRLTWGRSLIPASGITFTYAITPLRTGILPTNLRAVASYVDADGVRREYILPVPEIEVVAPTPSPTPAPPRIYLPAAYRSACIVQSQNADVALVIDTSGSMAGGKLADATAAAGVFVDLLALPSDQVAVVGFHSRATIATGLTGDPLRARAALSGLQADEGTNITAALDLTVDLLRTDPARRPRNKSVIILLSDGVHNAGPIEAAARAADRARSAVDALYAIGLGADADRLFLEYTAGSTRFFFAPDARDLAAIYQDIAARIPCR